MPGSLEETTECSRISFFNNSQQTQICVEANGQATDGSLLYGGTRP